jgi:hypothetical protein
MSFRRIVLRHHLGDESPTFGLLQGCSSATDRKIGRCGKVTGPRDAENPMRGMLLWFFGIPVPVIIALYLFNVI